MPQMDSARILQQINCVNTNVHGKGTHLSCSLTGFNNCPGDLVLKPMETCKYWRRLHIAVGAVENEQFGDDSDLLLLKLSSSIGAFFKGQAIPFSSERTRWGFKPPVKFY